MDNEILAEKYAPTKRRSSFLALDGSLAPIGLTWKEDITDYVLEQNRLVDENGGRHPKTNRARLRENLTLGNKNISKWLAALSVAGIESIRIGSKELAFNPERIDPTFFSMRDDFHEAAIDFMIPKNGLAAFPRYGLSRRPLLR